MLELLLVLVLRILYPLQEQMNFILILFIMLTNKYVFCYYAMPD